MIALAIAGAMSAPVVAQTAPQPTTQADAQSSPAAKPQMVKKRICEQMEEDSYSRLGGRKICRTVEVPVEEGDSGHSQQTQVSNNNSVQ
jgi:hypothetical protein